ncbi:uncharacterized protein LOC131007942 [Salvia miltiorrhiza]|uniref:uncharacterized protein LOC131007942 n=1 Tax=Salvia miltiorrhiza TaxID=226208 RepID=UPI0025ACC25C|nr:uncharacterized protein LOC131007942 [Salvia miltiorrhiza]
MSASSSPADKGGLNLLQVSNNFQSSSVATASDSLRKENAILSPNSPSETTAAVVTIATVPKDSYAKVTTPQRLKKPDLPAHKFQALRPITHGDSGILRVPSDLQLFQANKFQHALIGRLLLNKGEKPRTTRDLKAELQSLWAIKSPWFLMPMGKGYYTLKFTTPEDKATAKAHVIWDLAAGSIRLRDWVRYFNPYKESSSLAQVWVRIYYLPVEFWHPEVLTGIGHWLGQPLKIDGNSLNDEVAHFARILVEIDLAKTLPENFIIDGGDYSFKIEFCYEYLPLFCTRCKITGHSADKCRKGRKEKQPIEEVPVSKEPEWQPIKHGATNVEAAKQNSDDEGAKHNELSGPDLLDLVTKKGSHQTDNRFEVLENLEMQENINTEQVIGSSSSNSGKRLEDRISSPEQTSQRLEDAGKSNECMGGRVSLDNIEKEKLTLELDGARNPSQQDAPNKQLTEERATPSLNQKDETQQVLSVTDKKLIALENDQKVQRLKQHITKEQAVSMHVTQELSDLPKRGRGRPTKQDQAARNHNKALLQQQENIKSRLRKSVESGHKPRDYIIDYSNTDNFCTMDNIATKKWADEVELGGAQSRNTL